MLRAIALVFASIWIASLASAQIYVEARVGVAPMPGQDATFLGLPGNPVLPVQLEWGVGAYGGLSVGYEFDFGLRLEVNGMAQGNNVDVLRLLDLRYLRPGNAVTAIPMFDVLYDFDLGHDSFVPYLGAGVGFMYTSMHSGNWESIFPLWGSDSSFAWEVAAGFSHAIYEHFDVTVNYRYWRAVGSQEFSVLSVFDQSIYRLSTDPMSSHTVTMGLRYTFELGGGS